jgi:hypothetical protein
MKNSILAQRWLVQAALFVGAALLIFYLFGKTIIFFLVKAGLKLIGVIFVGLGLLYRRLFRKKAPSQLE